MPLYLISFSKCNTCYETGYFVFQPKNFKSQSTYFLKSLASTKRLGHRHKDYRLIFHTYSRFKLSSIDLFIVLKTSQASNLSCETRNFEYSHNGIPYLKLHVFAQSLLDTQNRCDYEDLIDRMNLPSEWGQEFLDLQGCIHQDWRIWRDSLLGNKWTKESIERYNQKQLKRLDI
jgi:hypothetical protein